MIDVTRTFVRPGPYVWPAVASVIAPGFLILGELAILPAPPEQLSSPTGLLAYLATLNKSGLAAVVVGIPFVLAASYAIGLANRQLGFKLVLGVTRIDPSAVLQRLDDVFGQEAVTKVLERHSLLEKLRPGSTTGSCTMRQRLLVLLRGERSVQFFVVNKDGSREDFRPQQLLTGCEKAAEKRDISLERLKAIAHEVKAELRRSGRLEIRSQEIGDMVMKKLNFLDETRLDVFVYCKLWLRTCEPRLGVDYLESEINLLVTIIIPLALGLAVALKQVAQAELRSFSVWPLIMALAGVLVVGYVIQAVRQMVVRLRLHEQNDVIRNFVMANLHQGLDHKP